MKSRMEEKAETNSKPEKKSPSEIRDRIEELPKIAVLKEKKKASMRKVDKTSFITNIDNDAATLSLYEKF